MQRLRLAGTLADGSMALPLSCKSHPRSVLEPETETPDQVRSAAASIYQQSVETHVMPLGNLTHMTEAEREKLGRWLRAENLIP